jgi:hypothetical protein
MKSIAQREREVVVAQERREADRAVLRSLLEAEAAALRIDAEHHAREVAAARRSPANLSRLRELRSEAEAGQRRAEAIARDLGDLDGALERRDGGRYPASLRPGRAEHAPSSVRRDRGETARRLRATGSTVVQIAELWGWPVREVEAVMGAGRIDGRAREMRQMRRGG